MQARWQTTKTSLQGIGMANVDTYQPMVAALVHTFGDRLKTAVLFGSQSRDEARANSDHDIFVVIDELPTDPIIRQREVTAPLLPYLLDLPAGIAIIAKTSQELQLNLTPLVIDVCMDGHSLFGHDYFAALQEKVKDVVAAAGLERRRLAGTWMWLFPHLPETEWDINWDGFREHV